MSKETLIELIEKHGAFVSPDGRSVFIAGDWYDKKQVETIIGEAL